MQLLAGFFVFSYCAVAMKQLQSKGYNFDPCIHGSVSTAASCNPHLERMHIVEVPKPVVRPNQALVRVLGSSVNPVDWKRFLISPPQQPLGADFSGVVEAVGPGCVFQVSDAVWAVGAGAYAEYVVQDCGYLSRKPEAYSFVQAGALGIVALTGLQAFRYAGAPWSTAPAVLVLGGSGGTGHVAIQLAKALGAGRVITTCSPDNFDFVRGLGADEVIDYHTQDWATVLAPRSLQVIYDCISIAGTGDKALPLLADGGSHVTLLEEARPSREAKAARPEVFTFYFMMNMTSSADLDVVTGLANEGKLDMLIQQTFQGLESVASAFETMMQGHTVGKIGLDFANVVGLLQRRLRPHQWGF